MLHFNEDTRVKFPATIQFLRLAMNINLLKVLELILKLRSLLIDLKQR